MFVAVCVLVFVGLGIVSLRSRLKRVNGSKQASGERAMTELDGLLREIGTRADARSSRQELAAVRGRTPHREHVWCAPGGEEVFLN